MAEKLRLVIWCPQARVQLQHAYLYIQKDSSQNAEKVRNGILGATRKLLAGPERFPLDKYKKDNDGSFRAFELFRYRVAYQVTGTKLLL